MPNCTPGSPKGTLRNTWPLPAARRFAKLGRRAAESFSERDCEVPVTRESEVECQRREIVCVGQLDERSSQSQLHHLVDRPGSRPAPSASSAERSSATTSSSAATASSHAARHPGRGERQYGPVSSADVEQYFRFLERLDVVSLQIRK